VPPLLRIKLLGDFGLAYGGAPVTEVDSARLQALLAYLVLHADAPQQRRHLAFSFWPDSSEKQARTNLRQLLHHLRHALPDADRFIESGSRTLQWRSGSSFTLDVSAFEEALSQAERARAQGDRKGTRRALKEAVAAYTGDLVPGCYDEWIEPERERLRQHYFTALEHLVRLLEEQRAYPEAIPYAERLLQGDALRETTYRTLMHLHALRNDRASALRVYQRCAAVLEEELGVAPGPATRTLYERLLDLQEPARRAAAGWTPGTEAELPLVGRQPEWRRLRAAWHRATHEQVHLAAIAGEAGTGKTRLAEELLTWAARQGVTTGWARCYAAEGRLAFAPIADWLRADPFRTALQALEPAWRIEVARILPEALVGTRERPPGEPLTESWQRRPFMTRLSIVLLPDPDDPTRAVVLPAGAVNETSLRTGTPG
jgi:DNA-binding SARP family transcriptional activator